MGTVKREVLTGVERVEPWDSSAAAEGTLGLGRPWLVGLDFMHPIWRGVRLESGSVQVDLDLGL